MIKNVSRDTFIKDYNSNPPARSACISIMNTTDTPEDMFELSRGWAARVRLNFDDIDVPTEGLQIFTKEHGDFCIKMFLDRNLQFMDDENIIIHCTAGVSRSAAFALFFTQLKEKTIVTDLNSFGWSAYNRHVYSTLVESFNKIADQFNLPNYIERIRQ